MVGLIGTGHNKRVKKKKKSRKATPNKTKMGWYHICPPHLHGNSCSLLVSSALALGYEMGVYMMIEGKKKKKEARCEGRTRDLEVSIGTTLEGKALKATRSKPLS